MCVEKRGNSNKEYMVREYKGTKRKCILDAMLIIVYCCAAKILHNPI